MRVHQWIGLALLTIGFGVGAWALIVGTMSDLGVALSVWGLGSLLAPASPFAPALDAKEWGRRWGQRGTLLIFVPIMAVVVIPSVVSGVAYFTGNMLLVDFDVPFWSRAISQPPSGPLDRASGNAMLIMIGVLWPVYWGVDLKVNADRLLDAVKTRTWRLAQHWPSLTKVIVLSAAMPATLSFLLWLMD